MRIEPQSSLIFDPVMPEHHPSPGGIPLGALPGDGVEVHDAEPPKSTTRVDCPLGTHAEVERLSPQSVEVKCAEDPQQKKPPPKKPPGTRPPAGDPDAPIIE